MRMIFHTDSLCEGDYKARMLYWHTCNIFFQQPQQFQYGCILCSFACLKLYHLDRYEYSEKERIYLKSLIFPQF